MRLFCANCTHHFTHGLVYPIWMPKRDSHSNSLLLSHCLPFGSLTTVYFLWFYVCISLNEYHRSSLIHLHTDDNNNDDDDDNDITISQFSVLFAGESIHSRSICLWPTFTLSSSTCTGIHTHSDVASPSCLSTYHSHINTHAWMLLFFVCSTQLFGLVCLFLVSGCVCLCVCV